MYIPWSPTGMSGDTCKTLTKRVYPHMFSSKDRYYGDVNPTTGKREEQFYGASNGWYFDGHVSIIKDTSIKGG
jgi:prepilin-type processing-associated H-X9-DG protein